MNSVQELNWAWQFWCERQDAWVQFECMDCLIIEFNFQAYRISHLDTFKQVDIIIGTVDFGSN